MKKQELEQMILDIKPGDHEYVTECIVVTNNGQIVNGSNFSVYDNGEEVGVNSIAEVVEIVLESM